MTTVATLIQEARQLVIDGDLDGAEKKKAQAVALKSIDAIDVKDQPDVSQRLPFPATSEPTHEEALQTATRSAVKSVYVKKYGTIDESIDQVVKEMYGTSDYATLHAMKMVDLNRYCKTGIADPRLMRQVLLSPTQIMAAIMDGVPVADGQYSLKATMVEAQDTLLGYMVPETLNMQIIERLPGMTIVRGLAQKYDTAGDQLSFLVRKGGNKRYTGGMRSKQTSESPTAGTFDTNATFGKLNIPVHVNLSKVPVSKSGLEDSKLDVMNQVLMPEFQTEAALVEDGQFLTGTGAGEPQGILTGTGANGAPSNIDVTIRNSGVAASVTNMDKLVMAPWDIAGQYRAKKNPTTSWAFTSATGAILATLKDGEGQYLWTEAHGNNAQGNPDTFRGWQYKESEALPEVGANTYPIIFGDFAGYRIVDRVGMSIQRYDDSTTADTDSVVFFCRRRYGGAVAEGYRFVTIKCSV